MKKVLIVEDSKVVREIIKAILEEDSEFQVIGEVESGEDAVEFVKKNKPDVITMDVNLRGKDGLYATREIMAENPVPIVIMSTLFDPKNSENTMKALEEGALSVFEKPKSLGSPEFDAYAKSLRRELNILAGVKAVKRKRTAKVRKIVKEKFVNTFVEEPDISKNIKFVAIGASTGGPQILNEIFTNIASGFNLPIIVVQHITPGFLDGLIYWMKSITKLKVKIAEEGELLSGGTIYFAPDNYHLTVTENLTVKLIDSPPVHSCKPSVSVFFDSVAKNFSNGVVAILLSGMGRDGADELLKIKNKGGITIAQDKESSVVFGMPKAAIDLGAASFVFKPEEISNFLNKLG
jgi:two-component system chemotaxis response regulator CheB